MELDSLKVIKIILLSILNLIFYLFIMCFGYAFVSYFKYVSIDTALYFSFSLSFVMGIMIILFIYRVTEFFIKNAQIAVWVAIVVVMIICFLFKENIILLLFEIFEFTLEKYLSASILFIFMCLYRFLAYLQFKNDNISVWSNIGSAHTARTTNVAYYIQKYNRIPTLNQNYGQSLFISIFEMLGIHYSFFNLYLFSVISMVTVFYFWIGFFMQCFNFSIITSIFSCVFVLFGQSNIRRKISICFDSAACNDFVISGYADAAISMCAFFYNFILLYKYYSGSISINSLIFVLGLCGVVWNCMASHFNVLTIGILLFNVAISLITRSFIIETISIFLIFVLTTLIGSFTGGMFTQKKYLQKDIIGQLCNDNIIRLKGIAVCYKGILVILNQVKEIIEALILPIIVGLIFIINLIFFNKEWSLFNCLGLLNILLIIGGLIIIYPFTAGNGHKHELNRFISPACVNARIIVLIFIFQTNNIYIESFFVACMYILLMDINIKNKFYQIKRSLGDKVFLLQAWNIIISKTKYITNDTGEAPTTFSKEEVDLYLKIRFNTYKLIENRNKKYIIYGAGIRGEVLLKMLKEMTIDVIGFSDGNSKMWNQKFCNLDVISIEELVKIKKNHEDIIILIASGKYFEIYNELKQKNISSIYYYAY
jgi:hypothetical protein